MARQRGPEGLLLTKVELAVSLRQESRYSTEVGSRINNLASGTFTGLFTRGVIFPQRTYITYRDWLPPTSENSHQKEWQMLITVTRLSDWFAGRKAHLRASAFHYYILYIIKPE